MQILNAVGALLLVYAFRYGKAIVVSPLINAGAPLLTALIALAVAGALPGPYKMAGIVLALAGALLLSLQPEARCHRRRHEGTARSCCGAQGRQPAAASARCARRIRWCSRGAARRPSPTAATR